MKLSLKFLKPYDALFLFAAAFLVALYALTAGEGFPLDDSWIHQVYGRNLAERGEWAFVPGQPSAASTSPLYTVLLAVGYRLGLHYTLWTHALGVLALAAAASLGARMAQRLLPGREVGILTGLALVTAWHLVWAASSGMETMLFSILTLAVIALAWHEGEAENQRLISAVGRGAAFGIVSALATLARPEGVMLAGMAGLTVAIVRPRCQFPRLALWSIAAVVAFLLVLSPYLLLNLQLTGGLLPDTAAAKQAKIAPFLANSLLTRAADMAFPLIAGGQLLLLPGLLAYVINRMRALRFDRRVLLDLLPLAWAVGLIFLYAARLPAPYQHGRYVIPALPSIILLGVAGSILLVRWAASSLFIRVAVRAMAVSAVLVFIYFAVGIGPSVFRVDVSIIREEMVAAAHWIRENVSESDLLAIHDIGAVGYFAPRPILDIAGLVSPEVVPVLLDSEGLYDIMRAQNARYLMAFPDQAPGADIHDPRLCQVFISGGETSPRQGGPNMAVYALAWDGVCPQR